jgi:hypothetical protein
MTTGFWTSDNKYDIALQYRFKVYIGSDFLWYAKSCDKPKINIQTLAKGEYYLGDTVDDVRPAERIDFQQIQMVMIDPVEPHVTDSILKRLGEGGCFPSISGQKLKSAFGEVVIAQVDHEGNDVERWTLKEAFPTSIDFGAFDYSSENPVEITIIWDYRAFTVETLGADGKKRIDVTLPAPPEESLETIAKLDGTFTL